jgi:hypothetical protein
MLRTRKGPLGLGRPVRSVYRGGADTSSGGSCRVPDRHLRGRLLVRSPDWQGIQRTPHQRTVAALGTLGEVKAGPLPPPLHRARLRSGRWRSRLAEQMSTRAQGACLTPVGQGSPQAVGAGSHGAR